MQINEVFLFSTLYAIYRLKMLTLYRAGMITLLPRDAIRSAAYTGTAPVRYFCLETVHPLKCRGNYIATSNNTVIGTLAVDGWAVTFGTARRGLGGAPARPGPSSLYQM